MTDRRCPIHGTIHFAYEPGDLCWDGRYVDTATQEQINAMYPRNYPKRVIDVDEDTWVHIGDGLYQCSNGGIVYSFEDIPT